MPLGVSAEGLVGLISRILAYLLVDICTEILIKGTGYLIVGTLSSRTSYEPDPEGYVVVITGFAFWFLIGYAAFYLWKTH